jgi:hypothetical protein
VARNAWVGIALLALTVAGCGGEAVEAKAAMAGQAQVAKVRARTDSIRRVRDEHIDSANASPTAAPIAAPADSTAQTTLAATASTTSPAGTTRPAGADSLNQDAEASLADSVQRAREIEVMRETFAYAGGTRDPFASLLNLDDNGLEIGNLDLVGVYMDLRTPSNSVIVLREKTTASKRHKMRVGDQLGRSRLVQIHPREAVFMIADFGYERQETLSLRKQEVETP